MYIRGGMQIIKRLQNYNRADYFLLSALLATAG